MYTSSQFILVSPYIRVHCYLEIYSYLAVSIYPYHFYLSLSLSLSLYLSLSLSISLSLSLSISLSYTNTHVQAWISVLAARHDDDDVVHMCIYHHHHHHVMPLARISLTLSRLFSLSSIACGRSSGLHPVSSHCCCMYVRATRPAFAWPYAGVHRSKSLMSSSLLLQQCPTCLVRLTCIVFMMGGK